MHNYEIEIINNSLEKTGKAIIAFGCSFTYGQGAIPLDILENFNYVCPRPGIFPQLKFKNKLEQKVFFEKYPEAKLNPDNTVNLHVLERKNSFVNILCSKFFDGEYTPINFGLAGNGNLASINQVNFFPQIKWNLIKELIVIYFPTDPARFSFINDEFGDNSMFITMWPHPNTHQGPKRNLWTAYFESLYTDKFAYLEAINNVCNLQNWVKQFNYKLIVFPAFSDYTKDKFKKSILLEVVRELDTTKLLYNGTPRTPLPNESFLLNLIEQNWPWKSMWNPDGKNNWGELLESYEDPNIPFASYAGKGSPNKWITPCIHPSAKAHDDMADRLYKYITTEL